MENIIFENSIRKWNAKERKYEKYDVPQGWNLVLYTENMDEQINCCQCGRKMRYGEAYTSLECHNSFGMGYGVCDKCYDDEWKRRKEAQNEQGKNN